MNIRELILNPDNFFKNLSNKESSLIMPLLIVLTLSVLNSIYTYYETSIMFNLFPPDIQSKMSILMIFSVASSVIGGFIIWLFIAGIIHLISMAFKGERSFKRTLEFIGYGFLPNPIGSLISILVGHYFLSSVQVPTLTMEQLQNPTVAEKAISSIIPKTMVYTNLLINIAVILWNLGLWTYGIKYARDLELKKAFIVALIPVVLFLIYQVYGVIKML